MLTRTLNRPLSEMRLPTISAANRATWGKRMAAAIGGATLANPKLETLEQVAAGADLLAERFLYREPDYPARGDRYIIDVYDGARVVTQRPTRTTLGSMAREFPFRFIAQHFVARVPLQSDLLEYSMVGNWSARRNKPLIVEECHVEDDDRALIPRDAEGRRFALNWSAL